MSSDHPYKYQPGKAFWRQTIAEPHFLEIADWYTKKWPITNARISTAGSCFAQHIGRYLRTSGFNFVDVERPPPALNKDKWLEYGYSMYSARYGNVYSPRQLLQLLQRALGEFHPTECAWELGDGFVDPFRPTIEPEPFPSIEEVEVLRNAHLRAVSSLFEQTDVFVFTLGLTEAWISKDDGAVFPLCPGTRGGTFDHGKYKFVNFNFPMIRADLEEFISRARAINQRMKFILTVSPVPLMATATNQQVLVATTYSKSILRSIAGFLADKYSYVDYFPSFEIISSHVMRGTFYETDMRSVADVGVDYVMKQFFREHKPPKENQLQPDQTAAPEIDVDDLVCDEELLAAFGDTKK
ncbi:GSCFA domain-containing protein [Nitrosomonas sp. Is37]|uniref:GSCFA domain-containing protein n=1 Tax=Nitrosomonas sp. Is37 TaxID=3080535 RepID=UPI00294B7BEF|nr:GSCFA domain-containing protein [Nitrosomonas sp. Is37]MDV6344914.1 GSCFA domain-containing protein [Nitrosomonas sp. Is37]